MSRFDALGGISALALCAVLIAPHSTARAQDAGDKPHILPTLRVTAPKGHKSKPSVSKPSAQREAASKPVPASTLPGAEHAGAASAVRQGLNQAPAGQTDTTIDRTQFDNRPAFSVGDVLHDSPGVSIKQGNGPRDVGISIRGSNARNTFAIRNLVIFDDGFPVTQPDGLSRSDLIDPHAYGAIDVIRGPSSALYGNYATGGALNFRTRRGGEIDGVEYGVDGGSFGYLNNYIAAGKKVGNFEASLFASDVRGDGFISNSWYNTQTVNFLGTLKATWDDRFTVKFINNDLSARLPIRLSLNQYYQNPFQQGCVTGATATLGCGTVTLLNNGFNKSAGTDLETALQAGLGRDDRRTIVGGRWEHDFDNQTTWRNQFVFDDRNIDQPTGTTAAIGDYPSYNYISDVTRRGQIFGLDSTTYFGGFYNTMSWSGDTWNLRPGGNATLGSLAGNLNAEHTNYGLRAREEVNVTGSAKVIAGFGWEMTELKGVNTAYTYAGPSGIVTTAFTSADRQFQNMAPELALLYRFNSAWQLRARVAGGYGTPQVSNLFVLADGTFGNNTQLNSQRNLGYDLGFDWTPSNAVKLSLTGFYEFLRDELVSQATPANAPNSSYTFNAPRSEHRGVELAADWRLYSGWHVAAAYTYLDEIYTNYVENITNGATFSFNRAGNRIPGVSPNELTARLGYDELSGRLRGLGGFVELQWLDSFYMDNANLLKAPGYQLVNLNLHYKTELDSNYLKMLSVFFEVRNLFDRTYIASANNIADKVSASGLQSSADVLAATQTGSIYAGSPRAFVAGMKIAFR